MPDCMDYLARQGVHRVDGITNTQRTLDWDIPCLSITCNNAPIFTRPHIPCAIRLKEGANKGKDVQFTKTHVARSATNTHKLQELERREHHPQNQSCSWIQVWTIVMYSPLPAGMVCVKLILCLFIHVELYSNNILVIYIIYGKFYSIKANVL